MNYLNAGVAELEATAKEFPEYTLGQIFYAVINRKPEGISIKEWLFNVSDEDMYTAIESTKIIEKP